MASVPAEIKAQRGTPLCSRTLPSQLPPIFIITTSAVITEARPSEASRCSTMKVGSHAITAVHCAV